VCSQGERDAPGCDAADPNEGFAEVELGEAGFKGDELKEGAEKGEL
jgi:hypothetical protein